MKKLSYTNLMSHPEKKLEDHLENVANFSKKSFNLLNFNNSDLFSKISFLIGLGHDFAKSTPFFQDYILTKHKNENTPHSFLSAVFTYYIVDDYLTKNNIDFSLDLAIISYIVVLHHHGNIKNIPSLDMLHEKRYGYKKTKKQLLSIYESKENLSEFYTNWDINFHHFFDNFDNINEDISFRLIDFDYEDNFDNYFNIILFYSVLLDADKMDASQTKIISRSDIPSSIVDEYRLNNFSDTDEGINKIRNQSYLEVNKNIDKIDLSNRIFSMNLPTGIGKTLTGLSSVLKLKNRIYNELGINARIIYSLPFLSIIDQNEEVIKNIFEDNGLIGSKYLLKHNYLADMNYFDENEVYDNDNSKILIEGWNSEFIITTFIQFFYSILGNKNSFLRKFHNISNSIILLDEIQSIPYTYWGIINSLLKKLAYEYNCWIILMTATQPLIFKEDEIVPLVDDVNYYFNKFNRIDYNFLLDEMYFEDFQNQFISCIEENENKNIMAVLNTVNSSKELYECIKMYFMSKYEDVYVDDYGICHIDDKIDLIYLSTNLIPFHRLKKINSIKKSDKQHIIITTQLIEAGVDIDVDIIYRDLAPLDSIIQTAGRCNRGGKKDKGTVNVISIKNDNDNFYSKFVYDSFLLNTTLEVLNDFNSVSEKDFNLFASKKYFNLLYSRNPDDYELKEDIYHLKFEDIQSKFKLIKSSVPKVDVFVCVNDDAEKIFDEYKHIVKNYSSFDRKNAFLKIKSKFYQYVISVDETKFGSANLFNDEIGVIYYDDLDRKYDLDVGFIGKDDEEPMIW